MVFSFLNASRRNGLLLLLRRTAYGVFDNAGGLDAPAVARSNPGQIGHGARFMSRKFHRLLLTAAMLPAGTVLAHHSPVMFDQSQPRTMTGTVREFQWTNPHSYIQLVVKNDQGQDEEWSLEMGASVYLYNLGWRPSTLKAGDTVTVTVAPLRKGGQGGLLLKAATADGTPIGRTPGAAK
jgi:hypothetical protein